MNVSSTFKLNNGNEIPVMALGSWDSRGDEAYQACLDALSSGYRHIVADTIHKQRIFSIVI